MLSLSPWQLCSILSWQPPIQRKKIKQGMGEQCVSVCVCWGESKMATHYLSELPSILSIFLNHCESSCQLCYRPPVQETNDSFRCVEMTTALCWWTHQNTPFNQIKGSRWALIIAKPRHTGVLKRMKALFSTGVRWSVLFLCRHCSCTIASNG